MTELVRVQPPELGRLSGWLASQQSLLELQHPWLRRLVTSLGRRHVVLLAVVGLVVETAAQLSAPTYDADLFLAAGTRLVHGDLTVFHDSYLQVGPVYLLLVGTGAALFHAFGLPPLLGDAVFTSAVLVMLVLAAGRAVDGIRGTGERRLVSGLALLLGGAVAIPASMGHAEEVMVALLLVVATGYAYQGRGVVCGVLLGTAISTKLWAVVAIGALLVLTTRRARASGGAAVIGVTVAAYLPFFLAGHVGTFAHVWTVQSPSPLSLLVPAGTAFDYRLRLIQVAVTAAAGIAIALRCRSAGVVWNLPIAVMSVRLLLDPLGLPYYWGGLIALVVLSLSTIRRAFAEFVLVVFVTCLAMTIVVTIAEGRAGAVLLTFCALAVLARPLLPSLGDRSP